MHSHLDPAVPCSILVRGWCSILIRGWAAMAVGVIVHVSELNKTEGILLL